MVVAEGNLEPLYIGPRWTSEIVPGGPLNMAFDPPGPRNNPPIRDFLYRQEVVADDGLTHHSAPVSDEQDRSTSTGIARIAIATADLGSDGGLIDG